MTPEELKKALEPFGEGLDNIQKSQSEQKENIEKLNAEFEASQKAFKEWQEVKDSRDALNQKAIDELQKIKAPYSNEDTNSFQAQLKLNLTNNFDAIKQVRKGNGFAMSFKGDMTLANSLTGSAVRSYIAPAILPNQIFNFRDMVQTVTTATGLITLPRETTPTGSASRVTEGVAKPQIEAKISMIDFRADYIAGYARISKVMLQDLPFLQSYLPRILLREFYKAENTQFYGDLTAVATGSTTTSGANYAEKVIDYMANLGAGNFAPNGIVGTFAEWASLLKTNTGASAPYSVPGGITIGPDGAVRIAGVPFRPANWVAAGKTIVGDWTQAVIAVADTLKVEFFEQDQDNVIKNMITVRVEAREVLVIEQPAAFVFA